MLIAMRAAGGSSASGSSGGRRTPSDRLTVHEPPSPPRHEHCAGPELFNLKDDPAEATKPEFVQAFAGSRSLEAAARTDCPDCGAGDRIHLNEERV